MNKRLIALTLLPALAWAEPTSQPTSAPTAAPTEAAADTSMGDAAVVHRGAKFTEQEAIAIDTVAAKPDLFAGKTLKVTGKVASVCKKKGCWMILQGTTPAAQARITFKDYGFFVPLDSAGTLATVEGVVSLKKLSEEERDHLAKDAGKKLEEMPAQELRITATAAELRKGDI